jgi:hypothetical protein
MGSGSSTVAEDEMIAEDEIEITFGESETVLSRISAGVIPVYPDIIVRAYLPDQYIRKEIASASINIGDKSYRMTPTGSYEGYARTPSTLGYSPFSIVVSYLDGDTDIIDYQFNVLPHSLVYEVVDGIDVPVPGARVILFSQDGDQETMWDGSPSGQWNPVETSGSGTFGFLVPDGIYRMRVEKDGFISRDTLPDAVTGAVSTGIRIFREPAPLIEGIIEELSSDSSLAEKTTVFTSLMYENATFYLGFAAERAREFADNTIVEQRINDVAVPTVTAVAVANVATGTATSALPFGLYLYTLLTHPTLLLGRRKRKQWGVVYNALTKLPVDLAIVRLLDAGTGRIVRTSVTDRFGRYEFIVAPGRYRLIAAKPRYAFPSVFLKDQKADLSMLDLYHGEDITVGDAGVVAMNIPLDPADEQKTPARVVAEGIARRGRRTLSFASILLMAVAAIISPTELVIALLAANVLLFAFFERLAVGSRPRSWGVIYDAKTKKPIQNVIARIFDTRYNKLLETQVTGLGGRYAFLVGGNVYYVTYEKPGYDKQRKGPMDMTVTHQEDEKDGSSLKPRIIAEDIGIMRSSGDGMGAQGGPSSASSGGSSLLTPPSAPPTPPIVQ